MIFRKREREDPFPNITPLVDILFLLIIFFTITTTFATTGGIDVNLPQASSQRELENVEKLFVVISQKGMAYIEGERMADRELAGRFRSLANKNPEALIIIEADQDTAHGRVVTVMDMAKGAGLRRLAIATEQKPAPAGEEEQEELPER